MARGSSHLRYIFHVLASSTRAALPEFLAQVWMRDQVFKFHFGVANETQCRIAIATWSESQRSIAGPKMKFEDLTPAWCAPYARAMPTRLKLNEEIIQGGTEVSLLIGMDEAGLGPNFGPFVVAATVWEVPGSPGDFDFWTAFDTVLTHSPTSCDPRLHVADSKQVFQPHRGLAALERGVWSALRMCGVLAETFAGLCQALIEPPSSVRHGCGRRTGGLALPAPKAEPASVAKNGCGTVSSPSQPGRHSLFDDVELSAARFPTETACTSDDELQLPWYDGDGLSLPVESSDLNLVAPWQQVCERLGVRLVAIRADVVEPLRFNRLVRRYDNKSQATSRLAMNLLHSVWQPEDQQTLVVADKHGGRNRYDTLLSETFGQQVECLTEGAELSAYRLGNGELRFQPRAESHGPVALASMTAKYLRELAMHQFNRFWQAHLPELKPTQGYPLDAKRFRDDITQAQRRLQIADEILWRER